MKKIEKIRLIQLSKVELEKREMYALRGGGGENCNNCACVCAGAAVPEAGTPAADHMNVETGYIPKGND